MSYLIYHYSKARWIHSMCWYNNRLCFHRFTIRTKPIDHKTRPSFDQTKAVACSAPKHPLSEPMVAYRQLKHREHIAVKFYLKFKHFQSQNAFENVTCKMAAFCLTLNVVDGKELIKIVSSIPHGQNLQQLQYTMLDLVWIRARELQMKGLWHHNKKVVRMTTL